MSKFIRLDTKLNAPAAPFAAFTPGVAGHTDQYVAAQVPGAVDAPVTSWAASDVGGTLVQTPGGTGPVTIKEEAGARFLRAPGGGGQGRLLGPLKGTLPFTIAAGVRAAAAGTVGVVGVNGTAIGRSSGGRWNSTGGLTLTALSASAAWVFVLLQMDAAKSTTFRVDAEELSGTSTLTPPSTFSGAYFGPSSAAQADILHLAYWPFAMTLAQRNAVHAFMREQYPVLA